MFASISSRLTTFCNERASNSRRSKQIRRRPQKSSSELYNTPLHFRAPSSAMILGTSLYATQYVCYSGLSLSRCIIRLLVLIPTAHPPRGTFPFFIFSTRTNFENATGPRISLFFLPVTVLPVFRGFMTRDRPPDNLSHIFARYYCYYILAGYFVA